jgi:hypothetical protein
VNPAERLDLARAREIRELLGDALRIYAQNFATVIAVAAAIVVPVQMIVSGIGLEELTAPYRESTTTAELLVPTAVSFLVVAPLIAAAAIHILRELAAAREPHPGRSLQVGLDVFAPVFLAVVLAGVGIAVGLLALIVPGLFLAVRWLFVPQAVVIDGARGAGALRASWEATRGFWWRTLGVILLANLVALLPGLLIVSPLNALAESADRQVVSLVGVIVSETITAPFVAIVSTLLFYDLRARAQPATQAPPPGQLTLDDESR